MKKTHKINDLEHVRLLADPLKLQLLQAFADGASTTKAVASKLGESVTKLYRHVDALHEAGLLEVVSEQQKRGTIERTFRAIAARFEVDQSLFTDDADGGAAAVAREVLRAGEQEIISALATGKATGDKPGDEDLILMRLRIRATPARMKKLRGLLQEWIDVAEDSEDEDSDDAIDAGALIAFYPLD